MQIFKENKRQAVANLNQNLKLQEEKSRLTFETT